MGGGASRAKEGVGSGSALGWESGVVGGGEGGTDCDAAESVFQIKKLNKRPQGQS